MFMFKKFQVATQNFEKKMNFNAYGVNSKHTRSNKASNEKVPETKVVEF